MNELKQLSRLLKSQSEIQEKLLELELQKKDILVKGDVDALNSLMISEQAVVMEADNMEKQRRKLQEIPTFQGKNLQTIVNEFAPDNQYSLSDCLTQLRDTVGKLKKVNELNRRLLRSRLQTIQYISNTLGIGSQSVVYKKG